MRRLASVASALVAVAVAGPFSACTSSQCLDVCDRKAWYLTCIEIDRSNLCNVGSLPVYHRADKNTFGAEPVALGLMQATRDGLWTVSVKFRETVVGFSGRTGAHEYEVVQLSGKADKSGQRICSQGVIPSDVLLGIATEVHVTKISDTKLKVQPATRNRRLPYVFTFDSTPVQARPVSIPLL